MVCLVAKRYLMLNCHTLTFRMFERDLCVWNTLYFWRVSCLFWGLLCGGGLTCEGQPSELVSPFDYVVRNGTTNWAQIFGQSVEPDAAGGFGLMIAPGGELKGVGDSSYQDFQFQVFSPGGPASGSVVSGDWSLIERGGIEVHLITDGSGSYSLNVFRLYDAERITRSRAWWAGMGLGGGVAGVMILLRVTRGARRAVGGL